MYRMHTYNLTSNSFFFTAKIKVVIPANFCPFNLGKIIDHLNHKVILFLN